MIFGWRWKWLHGTSRLILEVPSFASLHSFPSQFASASDWSGQYFSVKHFRNSSESFRAFLTPQVVQATLNNCPSDLIALTFFLWCARKKDYFHNRCAFDHMVKVVTGLVDRFGSVKGVLEQLNALGWVTKPQILLLLLRIFWQGGMHNLVFETFEEMLNYGYTPNTYARNIVMDAFFKIGRASVAISVLEDTQLPNFLTYSIALCNLSRTGDLITVRVLLRDMLRKGFYLNSKTFSIVLNCFCRMGRLREALQLNGLLITLGIPISLSTWSILIHGFCKSGNIVMAWYLLEKMVEAGCSPSVVTYTPLIKGLMKAQMPSSALNILKTMESTGCTPDLVLCNVLIDCFSKMGKYDEALGVFISLPEQKLIPDSYTFCAIMTFICLSRQFSLLPRLIRGLPIEADVAVCNSILNYFCTVGDPSSAVQFYEDMIDRGLLPDRYSFAGLLTGLCLAGKISEAVDVYHGIIRNHVVVDAHIHTIIIDGLMKSGSLDRAINLFRALGRKKYELDSVSYTIAIRRLIGAGKLEEAFVIYNQMKEDGMAPSASLYNYLISGLYRVGEIEKIKEIYQEAISNGLKHSVNAGSAHFLLPDSLSEDNLNVDSSSGSEGLPNVASSFG